MIEEYIGTNAELKAPSANSRRKKFGNLNASRKVSVRMLAPIPDAIMISRTYPVTRDKNV